MRWKPNLFAMLIACVLCAIANTTEPSVWDFSPPAKLPAAVATMPATPISAPAWDFSSPSAKAIAAPEWSFAVDTATLPLPIETVNAVPVAWNFTVSTTEACDCEHCKCPDCTCGKPAKPREAEPTLDGLIGHRLEYAKALEAAAKLRCQLIVTRGLDATETERWASEAERRRALFAVAKPGHRFDHDGAFRLAWHEPLHAVGILETLESKAAPIETVAMPAYSMPPVFPTYSQGGCSNGQCRR